MRKSMFLISVILFFNVALSKAQTEQGNFVLGSSSTFGLMGTGNDVMNIGISTVNFRSDADGFEEPDPNKITSINFIPKVGVFIANNLLIGLDISLAYQKTQDNENEYSYSSNLISVGPFLRYYIPTSSIKPFFELTSSFGYNSSLYEEVGFSNDAAESLRAFGGGFGMAIPIGSKISFDIIAHYTSFSMKDIEDNPNNNRIVVGTLGLKLGFVVFLGN